MISSQDRKNRASGMPIRSTIERCTTQPSNETTSVRNSSALAKSKRQIRHRHGQKPVETRLVEKLAAIAVLTTPDEEPGASSAQCFTCVRTHLAGASTSSSMNHSHSAPRSMAVLTPSAKPPAPPRLRSGWRYSTSCPRQGRADTVDERAGLLHRCRPRQPNPAPCLGWPASRTAFEATGVAPVGHDDDGGFFQHGRSRSNHHHAGERTRKHCFAPVGHDGSVSPMGSVSCIGTLPSVGRHFRPSAGAGRGRAVTLSALAMGEQGGSPGLRHGHGQRSARVVR